MHIRDGPEGDRNFLRITHKPIQYCTISTVSSRILKICWPRWPINFLLNSSDLKQGLFCGYYALVNLRSKWYSTTGGHKLGTRGTPTLQNTEANIIATIEDNDRLVAFADKQRYDHTRSLLA